MIQVQDKILFKIDKKNETVFDVLRTQKNKVRKMRLNNRARVKSKYKYGLSN